MQHKITGVEALDHGRLALIFDDGVAATLDLAPFFAEGEVTEPFRRDPSLFGATLEIGEDGEAA